jgi:hypothetical protein
VAAKPPLLAVVVAKWPLQLKVALLLKPLPKLLAIQPPELVVELDV